MHQIVRFLLYKEPVFGRVMPMRVGYILISTNTETLPLQQEALRQASCERVIIDEVKGNRFEQPGLQKAVDLTKPGDILVVWRLDRLGRSWLEAVRKIEEFGRRGVSVHSLHEDIDTSGSQGQHQLQLLLMLADLDRQVRRERIITGMRVAEAQGRKAGSKREMTPDKVETAARLMQDPTISIAEICRTLGISRATLYRYVGPQGEIRKR